METKLLSSLIFTFLMRCVIIFLSIGNGKIIILAKEVHENLYTIFSNACSEKLVIDTDGGADDAAGILLTLFAREKFDSNFEVVAITVVNGNVDQKTAQTNILKTLTIANAPNVNKRNPFTQNVHLSDSKRSRFLCMPVRTKL